MNNSIVTQNTAIAPMTARDITPNAAHMAIELGKVAWNSGVCKARSEFAAAMIMMKGYELGFPMTASFDYIEEIEGLIGLKPMGALALMRTHPEIVKSCNFTELKDKDGKFYGMECEIVRREPDGDVSYRQSFTLDDAQQAGLIKDKSNWTKYPKNMCRWRALGFCADIAVPDLMAGMTGLMKMPEIVEDLNGFANGDDAPLVIDVQEVAPEEITTAKLLAVFTPEEIMTVNKGAIPSTPEDCRAVFELLSAK